MLRGCCHFGIIKAPSSKNISESPSRVARLNANKIINQKSKTPTEGARDSKLNIRYKIKKFCSHNQEFDYKNHANLGYFLLANNHHDYF